MAKTRTPETETKPSLKVIDMTNAILGRACSVAAKWLLQGHQVVLVNAEKAIITGNRRFIIDSYKARHHIKTATNPRRGPFTQKQPDRIVRRTVRGMLPRKKASGAAAFKRLQVYIGVPPQFANHELIHLKEADPGDKIRRYVEVAEISKEFGWSYQGKRST